MVTLAAHPPQDIYVRAAWSSFFVLCIAVNVFVYCIKTILWSRGYPTSLLSYGQDGRNFKMLIAAESDPEVRRRYIVLRSAYRVCFVLFFVVPLTLVATSYATKYFQAP